MYISQIINFNEEHSNMPISRTLEKSWILNILRKESIFLYSKRKMLFWRVGVFTSLGVAIFWVTLRDRAQIFYENGASVCFHFLYTDQMWRVKRMWLKKISLIPVSRLLQCKLNKKKLTTWKRTNWKVISPLPLLMIIKLSS